jgi:glycerophosphoryl diester phosphodiesterase
VISVAEKFLASDRPLIIGHRGYCSRAPENTLPSFQLAIDAGADLVELDYHHSKDGVPIVVHDPTLDRTTDARKQWKRRNIKVWQRTATEIQSLDAGSWYDAKFAGIKIPLLSEALEFICSRGGVPLIEHKSGDAQTLARLLREMHLINRVVLISFDWKFLREFHALEPTQILGALGPPTRLSSGRKPLRRRRQLSSRLVDLLKTGATIAVWNRKISRRSIQAAQAQGLRVWIYTIDDSRSTRELLARGANALISNRIEAIQQATGKPRP